MNRSAFLMLALLGLRSSTGEIGASHVSRGVFLMLVFFVLCNTGGEIAMSYAMKRVGEPASFRPMDLLRFVWAAAKNRWLWLAIPMLAASFYSLLILFSWAPVSVVIPASASNFVVGTFCAKYLLKEEVSSKRWLGVVCVWAGVMLVLLTGGR
ncbi:MAG TPA: EamA family transporter [Candidatus Acidoferrum sp.]|nr:EamA family transporter [Candidatus Acidoferrum sp.]